ncbi:MAG TPA: hypothetical protein VK149_03445 [Sideroxyarcus sp.]|nr:hypothetical protein [Sideroxyarcus sp.]
MISSLIGRAKTAAVKWGGGTLPNENAARGAGTSERGRRTTPENQLKYAYRMMWVDPELRQAILDIREMDKLDGRVKRIHSRVARDTIRGGLLFTQERPNPAMQREWKEYSRRLQLNRVEKLRSDARGLVMEGNLPLQWVLDKAMNVVSAVRMPSETILPNVDDDGRFKDVIKAYHQFDIITGKEQAIFPLWQLTLGRYDPDNFDDMGSMGRPFLDATRTVWRKLQMTDEDLVIRRRMRAPLRMAHVLEGATTEQIEIYRSQVEKDQEQGVVTDYYSNKKGGVSPVQGDSNLDQIADLVYLLDTFFAGSPIPKGMMGYTDGLARDILEDLKSAYYEEVDALQDTLSWVYEQGFRLHLLLKGVNPDDEEFELTFAERRTESMTQTTDRGLKLKALGLPESLVWEELGYDPVTVAARRQWEQDTKYNPYPPADVSATPPPVVKITPSNARKGNSGTSISNG